MTTDDIISMARECGFDAANGKAYTWAGQHNVTNELEHLAYLIEQHLISQGYRKCAEGQRITQHCALLEEAVRQERELCAKVCFREAAFIPDPIDRERIYRCASAIRARGEPTQADALNAWAEQKLARHGIPMPCTDCHGIGYDASGQLCGCQP